MRDVGGNANSLDGVFEGLNVACPHVHDGVSVATHRARPDYFWNAGQNSLEVTRRHCSLAVELDIRFHCKSVDHRINLEGEPLDNSLLDQSVHASLDG